MSAKLIFLKGLYDENPVFRLVLGMCPTLAVTTTIINGIGMGVATFFVLFCSNVLVSTFRKVIPAKIRIPVFIIIIASFTTIVDLVLQAYFPPLHKALGLFIPLIVVNCIILGRAEAFASKNSVWDSIIDAFGMGAGFMLALILLAGVRELFGSYSLLGYALPGNIKPALIMILPPGAFLSLGILLMLMNMMKKEKNNVCG